MDFFPKLDILGYCRFVRTTNSLCRNDCVVGSDEQQCHIAALVIYGIRCSVGSNMGCIRMGFAPFCICIFAVIAFAL